MPIRIIEPPPEYSAKCGSCSAIIGYTKDDIPEGQTTIQCPLCGYNHFIGSIQSHWKVVGKWVW